MYRVKLFHTVTGIHVILTPHQLTEKCNFIGDIVFDVAEPYVVLTDNAPIDGGNYRTEEEARSAGWTGKIYDMRTKRVETE
jgi:hypothetical protein